MIKTPDVVGINRLLELVPIIRSEPLVGLAHRNLGAASDDAVVAHVRELFEACWDEGLDPSHALSLLCASAVGRECGFRKLTPSYLWEHYGAPSFDARTTVRSTEATSLIPDPQPNWWGYRFEAWAVEAAPRVPAAFRRVVGWSVLSTVLAERVKTPMGGTDLEVGLAGLNLRAREDALRLGGPLAITVQSSALATFSVRADRLSAVEQDDVATAEAIIERQGPPDHQADPVLTRLISEAEDGLERALAMAGGPILVRSSAPALEAVTALKRDVAARFRTSASDTMDNVMSGAAFLVRQMAALVAVAEGETIVSEAHQRIAIAAASDSIWSGVRYLETGRWVARQA